MLRCLLAVDEGLGTLLAALREQGELDRTLVVLSSDNGFFMGEHGLWDKRSAYEESMRVPMVLSWPAVVPGGARVRELCLNIDVAPTLLDAAGLCRRGRTPSPRHETCVVDPRGSDARRV